MWEIYRQIKNEKLKIKTLPAGRQDCSLKFKIFLKDKLLDDLPKETGWWRYKVLRPGLWWTQWRLPLELFFLRPKPDLFFTPGHYAPRFSSCPRVISIMDLAFWRFPEQFKKSDLWQLKNWTRYSIKKAAHIFTISEFTKKEIIHFYDYPEEKITVTYPGLSKRIKNKESRIKNEFKKLPASNYLLYLGTLQPRKNLTRLIEAFASLNTKYLSLNTKLVIAGKKGWLYKEIFNKVKQLGLEKEVIFTGFVSEKEKQALLKNALCFVYPSLYEGFGIPVLEAMAAGCPVVTSKTSSLPEVAGEAAVYIENPYSDNSIYKSLSKMLKSKQRERNNLIKKGLQQVKKFSWEKCAKKTIRVLQKTTDN